jgi:hypothetical protein
MEYVVCSTFPKRPKFGEFGFKPEDVRGYHPIALILEEFVF